MFSRCLDLVCHNMEDLPDRFLTLQTEIPKQWNLKYITTSCHCDSLSSSLGITEINLYQFFSISRMVLSPQSACTYNNRITEGSAECNYHTSPTNNGLVPVCQACSCGCPTFHDQSLRKCQFNVVLGVFQTHKLQNNIGVNDFQNFACKHKYIIIW